MQYVGVQIAQALECFICCSAYADLAVSCIHATRYAVRQDASNTQLKAGVLAAFALVKSIGAGDVLQASSGGNLDVQLLGTAGLYAAQSMLTFAFAATALEAAFGAGLLRRCGQPQR